MEEQVILVNEKDEPIGLMGKMEAHEKGLLHRAFSVFIFNSKQEVLLQHFKSVKRIREATLEELNQVAGFRGKKVYEYFQSHK